MNRVPALAFGVSVLVLALGAAAAPSAAAKEVKIKLATVAPEGTSWFDALGDFDARLKERTGGTLSLKIYPGAVQGDEKVVLRKMKAGQLQAAAFTGLGLGEACSWVRLLELPFQYRGYDEVDYIRSKLDERLRKEFEDRGYVVLAWSEVGSVMLFSNKPLKTVEDVKASKPWLWEGDPLAGATFRAFGVNPTPLALTDVLTSLQTGLIDTVYSTPAACIGLQWFTKVKYRVDVPLSIACGGLLVQKSFFDRLAADQKAALLDIGREYQAKLIDVARRENADGVNVLEEKGMETLVWEPREVERNHEIGWKVSDEMAGEGEGKLFPKALLDEVRAMLEEYRAQHGAPEGGK